MGIAKSVYLCSGLALFVPILFLSNCKVEDVSPDLLSDFQIQDNLHFELFSSEPFIKDPVAMEIDENGTIYVVEMPGYPLDLNGSGKVVILKDNDKNGIPDERVVFARDLILPTGIMRWKKGVIVTDAPDVLYLEDIDGDGKSDVREVLLTGFSRSNPQHNLNTPKYGLDNWIFLGHEGHINTTNFKNEFGDEGAEIGGRFYSCIGSSNIEFY